MTKEQVYRVLSCNIKSFARLNRYYSDAGFEHEAIERLTNEVVADANHPYWEPIKALHAMMPAPYFMSEKEKREEGYAYEDSKENTLSLTYGR